MARPELVVFGASNAAGLYDMDMAVDYYSSNITSAVYDRNPIVKNNTHQHTHSRCNTHSRCVLAPVCISLTPQVFT